MNIDIEDYYRRYGPMVLRRCRFILRDEDRALDAMQEVFVKMIRYEGNLDGAYPSALLYRIATNVSLNMARDEGRRIESCDADIEAIARWDDSQERIDSEDYIDYLFRGESPSTREMAVMHYLDGMTLAEVARESGLSVPAVRKRLAGLKARIGSRIAGEKP